VVFNPRAWRKRTTPKEQPPNSSFLVVVFEGPLPLGPWIENHPTKNPTQRGGGVTIKVSARVSGWENSRVQEQANERASEQESEREGKREISRERAEESEKERERGRTTSTSTPLYDKLPHV